MTKVYEVMCAEEQVNDGGRSRFRWVEAIALTIVTVTSACILFVLGPFSESSSEEDGQLLAEGQRRHITIAVAPLLGREVIPRELTPVAAYLSRALSADVDLSPTKTTEAAVDRLVNSSTDIAVLPALACVQAKEAEKSVRLIVVQSFEHATSTDRLLVARRSDGLSELHRLQGQELCYADRFSTAYLLARVWIRSRGRDPDTFFGQHHACGNQLEALRRLSKSDAGCHVAAISAPTLKVAPGLGIATDDIEVIARTGHVPHLCWAAAPRLNERLSFNLIQTLVSFEARPATGAPMVGQSLRITTFRDVRSTTFRAVRIAAQLENWL